jgi:hypothetical protein
VNNAKIAKMLVKGAASLLISVTIGYTYKAGKKIDMRIDEHFDKAETDQAN